MSAPHHDVAQSGTGRRIVHIRHSKPDLWPPDVSLKTGMITSIFLLKAVAAGGEGEKEEEEEEEEEVVVGYGSLGLVRRRLFLFHLPRVFLISPRGREEEWEEGAG